MSVNLALQPCRDCGARPGRPHFDGCPMDGLLTSVAPRQSVPPFMSAESAKPPPPPKYPADTPQAEALHRAIKRMGG
jgi:hypothetical protein